MPRKIFDINPSPGRKPVRAKKQTGDVIDVPVQRDESKEKKAHPAAKRKSRALQAAEQALEGESNITALLETFIAEKDEVVKKTKPERKFATRAPFFARARKPIMLAAFVVLAAFGVYSAGLAMANVRITLETQSDAQDQNYTVTFKKGTPASSTDVLPLAVYHKDFSYSKTYEATGTSTQDVYVTGTVVLYNTAQQTPQILVQATRLAAPNGLLYRLMQRVSVPGYTLDSTGTMVAGQVIADVRADRPGSSYALDVSRFTIPGLAGTAKYTKIYAASKQAFAYDPASARTVSDADIRNAKQDVAQYAFDQAKADLVKTLPDSVKLFDQALSISVTQISTNAAKGDQASTFRATISGTLALMVFDEKDIVRFVGQRMPLENIQSDIVAPHYQFTYENPRVDFSKSQMTIVVHARRQVSVLLDNLTLRQRVSGKTLGELRAELLAIPGLDRIEVSAWPFWVTRVPENIDRIAVDVR